MKPIIAACLCMILLVAPGCTDQKPGFTNTKVNAESDVIETHGRIQNLHLLDEFVQRTDLKPDAKVRLVRYTIEGDPIFYDLSRDDHGTVKFRYDNSEDKFGNARIVAYTCKDIKRAETDIELTYTAYSCSGEANERQILRLDYDVQKQDVFAFSLKHGVNLKNEINTIDHRLVKDLQNGETVKLERRNRGFTKGWLWPIT